MTGRSIRSVLAIASCTCLVSIALSAAVAAAPAPDDVSFDFDSAEVDFRTQQSILRNLRMRQGEWTLTADEAVTDSLDAADGVWKIRGSVRLRGQGNSLDADAATVEIVASRLAAVIFTGRPATFEQVAEGRGSIARGQADTIDYKVTQHRVDLRGDARLWMATSKGHLELANATIQYDLLLEKFTANNPPGSGGRVKGKFTSSKSAR